MICRVPSFGFSFIKHAFRAIIEILVIKLRLRLRPIATMMKMSDVSLSKRRNEVFYEIILWLLRKSDPEQFEISGRLALPRIVGKAKVAREAYVKILDGKLVEPSIIQPLHP
jgi:hypothetical protein